MGVRIAPGVPICPSDPTGRGAWLRTRMLGVRIPPRVPVLDGQPDGSPASPGKRLAPPGCSDRDRGHPPVWRVNRGGPGAVLKTDGAERHGHRAHPLSANMEGQPGRPLGLVRSECAPQGVAIDTSAFRQFGARNPVGAGASLLNSAHREVWVSNTRRSAIDKETSANAFLQGL